VVAAVQAMRGVAFIIAVTVVAEVGDVRRFDNPRQLMAYLGLTPSEHSSGASVLRGGITKAGSGIARRALIEGAWSDRMQAQASPPARGAAQGRARHRLERQLRMCQRHRHLVAAAQAKVVVTTAIAREMVGFIWAIARAVMPLPDAAARIQGREEERRPDQPMRKVGGGRQWETLVPCYEPTRSTLAI
jgi:hypothetical protein